MDHPTPLIICGMGRSGTRNAANVLNRHQHVRLYGEMPSGIMASLFDLLDTLDRTYSRKGYHDDLWAAKKSDFLFASLDHLGKAPRADAGGLSPKIRYAGHKTPHHELLGARYEHHFGSVGLAPEWLYCARDVRSCWRSYKSMPWNSRELDAFLDEYEESFEHLERLREMAPGRVHVVSLNGLISADDQLAWYVETLFQPLKLKVNPVVAERIAALRNNNATVKVTGRPPVELTDAELEQIAARPTVQAIQDRYFAAAARA